MQVLDLKQQWNLRMPSKNDITGDLIKTKTTTESFRDNYDLIDWGRNKKITPSIVEEEKNKKNKKKDKKTKE